MEQWDASWTTLDGYRGVNANMHTVEALLAAADVLDDCDLCATRALRIVTRVVHDLAPGNQWRIPEHFDASWTPQLEYNPDQPAHPFRPYGATIGHSLEWSRLALHLRAGLGESGSAVVARRCRVLFDAAVREGWAVDGRRRLRLHRRLVRPPRRTRADALGRRRGHRHRRGPARGVPATRRTTPSTGPGGSTSEACSSIRSTAPGATSSRLTCSRASLTWAGKPDTYHAFQATLIPRLPLAPTLAEALRRGLLA